MASSTKNLVVTLPPELGRRVRAAAEAASRTPDEVVADACRAHFGTGVGDGRDEQYQRGYETVPEETAEVEAMLKVAPVPAEDWS